MRLSHDGSEPVGQLSPQDWMALPETAQVIAALKADGAEVRFVGGCVRDSVLKRPIKDIDIATHDTPDRVMDLARRAGLRVIPTGIAHGTVTVVADKMHYEVTTLHQDVESFGRRARVAFTDDWVADAARRDFTINAMSADPLGRIYDPFNGLADLAAGQVRFVGDPMKRLDEDVLRLLRFFRFFAHYGRGAMDPQALAACRKMAPRLAELSGERVAGEILRLLAAPDPAAVLLVMKSDGILAALVPDMAEMGRLKMLCWLESRAMVRPGLRPDPLRRLGAALSGGEDAVSRIGARLKLSNAQIDRLFAIACPRVAVTADMGHPAVRRALRAVGADTFRDLVLTAWAEERSRTGLADARQSALWQGLLDQADAWVPVELPVKGADCLDLGLKPGPAIGAVLARVEAWWEAAGYTPDRAACLDRLRQEIGSRGG